jgi:CBS domain-containing protein
MRMGKVRRTLDYDPRRRTRLQVQDIMNSDVASVTPSTPLKAVGRLLVQRGISSVLVIGDDGSLLGVVSEEEILLKEGGPRVDRSGLARWMVEPLIDEGRRKFEAKTAGEAMRSPAPTIRPERSVATAAEMMIETGVHQLAVVSAGGLVGIVTRADLVRAFVRSDAEIVHEIREDVLHGLLWLAPQSIQVTVEQGEVALAGEVERKLHAELLPALAARVPGVISVNSDVTWSDDSAQGVETPRLNISREQRAA